MPRHEGYIEGRVLRDRHRTPPCTAVSLGATRRWQGTPHLWRIGKIVAAAIVLLLVEQLVDRLTRGLRRANGFIVART